MPSRRAWRETAAALVLVSALGCVTLLAARAHAAAARAPTAAPQRVASKVAWSRRSSTYPLPQKYGNTAEWPRAVGEHRPDGIAMSRTTISNRNNNNINKNCNDDRTIDSTHQKDKRTLALLLISRANAHKDRSLRDVLRERAESTGKKTTGARAEDSQTKDDKKEQQHWQTQAHQPRPKKTTAHGSEQDTGRDAMRALDEHEHEENEARLRQEERNVRASSLEEPIILRTLSEVFAWAVNSTVQHMETHSYPNASHLVYAPHKNIRARLSSENILDLTHSEDEIRTMSVTSENGETNDDLVHGNVETVSRSGDSRKIAHEGQPALPVAPSKRAREASAGMNTVPAPIDWTWTLEMESDVMFEALRRLQADDSPPQVRVNALLVLEELCHSIDNGVDLHAAGGLRFVVESMTAREARVRASAAWALGTCAQNNPTVQNASVTLGAVPVLVVLAADDEDLAVCARALLALNALLELTPARNLFEEMALSIQALRRPLVEQTDARATRRALNLAELLVRSNLDNWKPQLEAWDLGPVVENLMRNHKDVDVRESAARLISALDGRSAL